MILNKFDLDKALAGEPVISRDGQSVSIIGVHKLGGNTDRIVAYFSNMGIMTISIDGTYLSNRGLSQYDLFMKVPTIKIGDYEFEAPETKIPAVGTEYYATDPTSPSMYTAFIWTNHDLDFILLKRGLVHKTKEGAVNHTKAMIIASGGGV